MNFKFYPKKSSDQRINERISASEVRVIGIDGKQLGVLNIKEALKAAENAGSDLVEISPKAVPPVCKVMDYKKFLFEQKKREKYLKSKTSKVVIKEIRFGPNTDDHDFNFKLKHAIKFLENGAKVKAYVHFYGRTIVFKERGEILLLKLAQALEDYANVEELPKLEGKRMFLMLSPKK